MTIGHINARRFGAFTDLDLDFVPGINVLLGANATGKSQLLKLLYVLHTSVETNSLGGLGRPRSSRSRSRGRFAIRLQG